VGPAVQEISYRAQQLVREEIELAKAELTAKVTKLAKGVAVGVAGGIFGVVGLLFFLHGLSWGFSDWFGVATWIGYWITTVILFVLAGLAAFLASRLLKSGSPPKPEMAIDEAQRIKQTVEEARR
jgi:sterol desaturase/sphingolipid hydroxylase (fatty acid hydroxylase superfamily)